MNAFFLQFLSEMILWDNEQNLPVRPNTQTINFSVKKGLLSDFHMAKCTLIYSISYIGLVGQYWKHKLKEQSNYSRVCKRSLYCYQLFIWSYQNKDHTEVVAIQFQLGYLCWSLMNICVDWIINEIRHILGIKLL